LELNRKINFYILSGLCCLSFVLVLDLSYGFLRCATSVLLAAIVFLGCTISVLIAAIVFGLLRGCVTRDQAVSGWLGESQSEGDAEVRSWGSLHNEFISCCRSELVKRAC
jgi:hypothetical protein